MCEWRETGGLCACERGGNSSGEGEEETGAPRAGTNTLTRERVRERERERERERAASELWEDEKSLMNTPVCMRVHVYVDYLRVYRRGARRSSSGERRERERGYVKYVGNIITGEV